MGARRTSPPLVDVALPLPVDKIFTYRLPEGLPEGVSPGCRVRVPFGPHTMTGYVVRAGRRPPGRIRLREIDGIVDHEPLLDGTLLELARWMADYYVHPIGEVLRAMLPAGVKGTGRSTRGGEPEDAFPREALSPELTGDQRAVFDAVTSAIAAGRFERFLLHGVTGSGKTEVYLRCIERVLEAGGSALVLVPEIALIPQTTSRFRRRFGETVAVLHSRLTGAERHSIWRDAKHGAVRVIIGPRSSVFVPLPRLGIIVVDEEQDSSFKQEEKPHYHAVVVAEQRARRGRAVLLLGSATPSLEMYDSAQRGQTSYYLLRSRPDGARLPRVEIIDMRGRRGLLSEELITALERCVAGGDQGIVLLNRRGHANFIQCKKCGWVPLCPNCSISLTFHSRGRELLCHYCGHREPPPESCPQCGKYRMLHRGAGTQRVEVEIANLVRGARVIRMDLDTTTGKRGHLDVLERFARHEANILLGTQMVAKGHHFPDVTLMGVVAADQGLGFPDFRATERTFRLLFQAAGRTGRGGREGLVLVQTYVPEHYLFEHLAAHDYETFARAELSLRYDLRYPPGGALTLFTVSSAQPDSARDGAERVTAALGRLVRGREVDVLGPAPALIERLKRRFRAQVLVKGDVCSDLNRKMVGAAKRALAGARGVELQWDIDPGGVS